MTCCITIKCVNELYANVGVPNGPFLMKLTLNLFKPHKCFDLLNDFILNLPARNKENIVQTTLPRTYCRMIHSKIEMLLFGIE